MKIKKLKFSNINSFKGEFEIDFEKFYNDVFLISGPTGSGKTTIIDAILAAIYNKTPRLSHTRELINKDSKEAFIVLEFELDRDEFKITWKGKKRPKSTEIKRSLYINGEEVADKEKEIDRIIFQKIKLSFNEFTKAIVLAQGKFDAFLSAKSDEKMKLLETILDVEEFEKISIKIFEKHKELESEIEDTKKRIDEINVENKDLKEKLKEFEKINRLLLTRQKELNEVEENLKKLREKNRLLEENRRILDEIKLLQEKLKNLDMEAFQKKYEESKKSFETYEKEYIKKNDFLDEEIKKEIELKNLKENLKKLKERKEKGVNLINEISSQISKIQRDIEILEKNKNSLVFYNDKALEKFDEIYEIYTVLKNLEHDYREKNKNLGNIKKHLIDLKNDLEKNLKKLDGLKSKKEYLEAKILVLKYEKERENLRENSPCPLCGSIEHPYVKNPPKIEENIKNEYLIVNKEIENTENKIAEIKSDIGANEKLIASLNAELQEIIKRGKNYREKIKLFGIEENEIDELKRKKQHNEQTSKEFDKINLELEKKKIELKKMDENIKRYTQEIENINGEINETDKKIFSINLKVDNPSLEKEKLKKEYEKKKNDFENIKLEFFNQKEMIAKIHASLKEKEDLYQKNLENINKIIIKDENFELKVVELKKEISLLNTQKGEISKELEYIRKELQIKNELLEKIKQKDKVFKIYSKLNKVIGSKDGKRFKQIAINKMIDGLIFTTNVHLEKLSDGRYLLSKSEEVNKIELDIIDRYYENKKRSVNTLSGGEKFLVSLSLAFALSDMIRDRVKIDFMFLDEGFGTLDGYNLIKTLEILKKASRGKTIGIISHVDALKEEIQKGISVIKKEGGKSFLKVY